MGHKRFFIKMAIKKTYARKPDLLVIVAFFVAVGFLPTSLAQADNTAQIGGSERWWQSIWGTNLSENLASWRPMISVDDGGKGMRLARPFGKSGPTLQVAPSMPYSVTRSLKDAGDTQIGAVSRGPEAFLFLQKRW